MSKGPRDAGQGEARPTGVRARRGTRSQAAEEQAAEEQACRGAESPPGARAALESGLPAKGGAALPTIRVLLAEDQAMVRGALAALLALEPDIQVVGQVARGDQVVSSALALRPDVALLDIEMPGLDGLQASARLREALPSCRVLILTTFGRPGYLRRAMEGGASGFLLKDAPATDLAVAIRRAHRGERVVDPGLAAEALSEGVSPLTEREQEVLAASLEGGTNAEIAARLFLSEGTVRNHLSAAIQKLGARNRVEAARVAQEKGWL